MSLNTPIGIFAYKYDQQNRPIELARPQGLRTKYTYESEGRLTSIRHLNATGAVLIGFKYRFDELGNLIESVREEGGTKKVSRYSYDDHPRLIEAFLTGGRVIRYKYRH